MLRERIVESLNSSPSFAFFSQFSMEVSVISAFWASVRGPYDESGLVVICLLTSVTIALYSSKNFFTASVTPSTSADALKVTAMDVSEVHEPSSCLTSPKTPETVTFIPSKSKVFEELSTRVFIPFP